MGSFQDIVMAYAGDNGDFDRDGVKDIETLELLPFENPSERVDPGKKLVVVITESRLLDNLAGSHYTTDDLLQRLLTFKHDLRREGRNAKFLKMTPYYGPILQEGKTLLAIREFFNSVRDTFRNFEGAILIGSFPEASIIRTWPQYFKDDDGERYHVGLTPSPPAPRRADIVLADLDGNWRDLYHTSVDMDSYTFTVTPLTSVSQNGSKVILTNPKIDKTTVSLQDIFWIRDAAYCTADLAGGLTKVEFDTNCVDPEVSALDKLGKNPVARPDICVSRINAQHIAVQPPNVSFALDANGKPQETTEKITYDYDAWWRDPKLERTLLIDYFDRNHAFRSGSYSYRPFTISMIESKDLGTVAAEDGLQGLTYPRDKEVRDATLLTFTRWLKRPAIFRVISSHADCSSTGLKEENDADTALAESEAGGHPWRWIEENGKYVPSFKGQSTADLFVFRTLWENGELSNLPPSLMLHVGCDVNSVSHTEAPYNQHPYGTFQNAESLLFYANQLAVVCRVTWWNRGPLGFGGAFNSSDSVLGDGWKGTSECTSQDAVLAQHSTERKQNYIWSIVGDWTLRKYYRKPIFGAINGFFAAIDQLSMVVPAEVYQKITEGRHPHEALVPEIEPVFQEMTPKQRKEATSKAETLIAIGKGILRAAAKFK